MVRLHYAADPTMTPERIATLKAQYTTEKRWEREMEISYQALSGQLVFPGFNDEMHTCALAPLRAAG